MTKIKRFEINHIEDGYHEVVIEDDAGAYPGIYVLASDHDAAMKAKDAEIAKWKENAKGIEATYLEHSVGPLRETIAKQARVIEERNKEVNYLQECVKVYGMEYESKIDDLIREIELLRLYGNKDCTAMADEALNKEKP